MPRKKSSDNVKNIMQIHSKAKVDFYGAYLQRYLRILALAEGINNINIYDVFCGTGIYENGGKGSPVVAFDIIKELHFEQRHGKKISLCVNDSDKGKVNAVKTYIDSNNKNYCSVSYYEMDADNMFMHIQNQVGKSSASIRNLVFIDPYGYKKIRKENIDGLMNNKRTEIVLFLPISHMYRFTGTALIQNKPQYKPLQEFVNSFFDDDHPIKRNEINDVMHYIDCICSALRFGNKYYTASYYIERDAVNYFALFFLSPHVFGLEKILEVKWILDSERGAGFKQPDPQQTLFAEAEKEALENERFDDLRTKLLSYIVTPRNNHEIYLYTLNNGYLPVHANKVFKQLQDTNDSFKVTDIL